MFNKKILIILGTVIMLLLTGCKSESSESSESEVDNIGTEELADTQNSLTSENAEQHSYAVGEMLADLRIQDTHIGWPCTLGDIQGVFELGDPYRLEEDSDDIFYDLYFEGNDVGLIIVSEPTGDESEAIVTTISLEYVYDYGVSVEFQGVTEDSTYSEVVELLGEPTVDANRCITYYDLTQERTEAFTYDVISITFMKDGRIRLITLAGDKNQKVD